MKVGDLFTKRDFKSRIFVVSRQIYVIRNANHWFCVYLGELSGTVVIPLGQLFRDPSWHWEVEKCFYMYDPTPTIHLTFDYGNYLRCEQGELIQRKKNSPHGPFNDMSVKGGNNGNLCCHTNSGLGTNFPIFGGPWSLFCNGEKACLWVMLLLVFIMVERVSSNWLESFSFLVAMCRPLILYLIEPKL